jgi:hypothetical protein
MSDVLSFSDVNEPSKIRSATVKLRSGEHCVINVGPSGVVVKKAALVSLSKPLFAEADVYMTVILAGALSERFPINRLPKGFNHPVLSAFTNALLYCSTSAEVRQVLNKPVTLEKPSQNGLTPATAIPIKAANSAEGIPKEYAAMIALFGRPNRDWKKMDRSTIEYQNRILEKFILSVADRRTEVYFDITGWVKNNVIPDRPVTPIKAPLGESRAILLPKEELFTLEMILMSLSEEQLRQIGMPLEIRNEMLAPIVTKLISWKDYNSIPPHVEISLPVASWSRVYVLLRGVEPANLLQEEEIENLKAIIGGAI